MIDRLNHQNTGVRMNAALILGDMAMKGVDRRFLQPAIEPLINALINALKDQNESVRRNAVDALGKIGDAKAAEALMNALKDQDGYLRISAIKALEQIRDKCDIDAIKEKISEELWREVILPRVKKKYENEGEEWLTYVNTEQHFRFQYPKTWNLTALKSWAVRSQPVPIFVSLNNASMDNFWVNELRGNSGRGLSPVYFYHPTETVDADQFPPGCVYVDVKRAGLFGQFGGVSQSYRYTETEALDVINLIDETPGTPAEDIRFVKRELSFLKWRRTWIITIYLREPISERNRQMVDRILRSFQLDAIPAGDELWALGEAIKHLPPEADPEVFQRFISTGSVGLHSVRTERRGDEVIVTFTKGTKELKQTWQFRVTATGKVIRMED